MNNFRNPKIWITTAICLVLLAFGISSIKPDIITLKVNLLVIGSIIGIGGFSLACNQRLHENNSDMTLGLTTFGLSLTFFISSLSMDQSWDSMILASSIFTYVTFFLGIFFLLPVVAKKNSRNLLCPFSFCGNSHRSNLN